ncbi:MAG: cellulase family glycosylhydrolase [Candidatus Nitrosocaldaceae archaeon]
MNVIWKKMIAVILVSSLITLNLQYIPIHALPACQYVEVPSDSSLELTTFRINIIFKLSDINPNNTRMYLISKGNNSNNNDLLNDQNYSIYITRTNKIVFEFKDVNDDYHYIYYYKMHITDTNFHSVTATYAKGKMTLNLDGIKYTKILETNVKPDTDGNKPLRIGANSNIIDKGCLDGEIKSVSIKTMVNGVWTEVYNYNSGGGDGGGDGGEGSCSTLQLSKFTGVVFMDPILSSPEKEKEVPQSAQPTINGIKYLASKGFTGIRIPFYWEAYTARPADFLARMKLIADTAEKNGICIIWDNHHYYTTSAWKLTKNGNHVNGRGFPSFITDKYNITGEYDDVAYPFWRDFLKNEITVNGKKVWDLQVDFLTTVINTIEPYKSTKALEILNEPHIWSHEQYDDLGDYLQYMTTQLRKVTDMTLIVKRETVRGTGSRDFTQWFNLIPNVPNIAFGPHLYALPCDGCKGEKQLQLFKQLADKRNIEIYIGEFAARSQSEADTFISKFKSYGFGWTEYRWAKDPPRGFGAWLYVFDGDPTPELRYLLNAYSKYY